jgi:NAD(P)H dehydrogenase (quinone)
MNISVILGHPNTMSFNHAIARTALDILRSRGHTIFFHDLYAEGFDPNLPYSEIEANADLPAYIRVYCEEVKVSNGFIIIHPNWWSQPPAVVKGWIDRVFRPGVAYNFLEGDKGEGIPISLLKAESAIVFNTSNTPAEREIKVFGDPLETLWKNCIFGLCGVKRFVRKKYRIIVTSTLQQRKTWLKDVEQTIMDFY